VRPCADDIRWAARSGSNPSIFQAEAENRILGIHGGGWLHDDASLLERDTALIRITQWNSACRIQGSWHDRTGTSRCTCGKPPQTNKGRRCRFTLPRRHWFVPGTATVPTTGEAVLLKDLGDTYGISINNLGSHMLIWIPNKGSGTVRCLGKNDNLACITVDCVK